MHRLSIFACLFLVAATVNGATFSNRVIKGQVTHANLTSITGMAASRAHNDVVYVHNYQFDGNYLYAINVNTGALLAQYTITGARNFDWEDVAVGPCVTDCRQATCSAANPPQSYCIYIADIGSHRGDGAADVIYMVREPQVLESGDLAVVESLTFSWSEVDAETLMVAPDARVFVVSKVDRGRAMIAELPKSAWGKTVALDVGNTGVLKIYTDHHDPQGGDISPDGKEVVLVGEEQAFYLEVSDGDYINAVRTKVPETISNYRTVPDTEAIAWRPDGKGFYTVAQGQNQYIYFYPKYNQAGTVIG